MSSRNWPHFANLILIFGHGSPHQWIGLVLSSRRNRIARALQPAGISFNDFLNLFNLFSLFFFLLRIRMSYDTYFSLVYFSRYWGYLPVYLYFNTVLSMVSILGMMDSMCLLSSFISSTEYFYPCHYHQFLSRITVSPSLGRFISFHLVQSDSQTMHGCKNVY
ncbi:hypothetical protein QBC37DRAFT_93698 [Rhypophila decipiens]|uniref:Uncharacterized protein n=1 Tax=Rhypophila decipiens TaxID=261697 RepID=A0AAN6YBN1_9PEZI|nr:hypothetical protein QBC37DRAFT_93698 [Rhypophila decipiens]